MSRRAWPVLRCGGLAAAFGLFTPLSNVMAQGGIASRSASVQLVVVKPPTPLGPDAWIAPSAFRTRVLPDSALEVTTAAGIGGRVVRQLDVLRPRSAVADLYRLSVRDASGTFVPLAPGAAVTIARNPTSAMRSIEEVVLRTHASVDPDWPSTIPLTVRLTFGEGERRTVWSYTLPIALVRDTAR